MDKRAVIQSIGFGSDIAEHEAKDLAKYFVETDQWNRIFAGDIDVIYGAKGSGKSAIYHLIMSKREDFLERKILLVEAENPKEDPAFSEIRNELPPTEEEFRGLWKLYLCSVAAVRARDFGIKNKELDSVLAHLATLDLVEKEITLNTIVRYITDYVAKMFRPLQQVSATTHLDPSTGTITGVTGSIIFREPTSIERKAGLRPIKEILNKLNEALNVAGYTVWLLLDRLDVAFIGNEEIEARALRALFAAYKDMHGFDRICPKLFVRTDIWDRMLEPGFREATHAASPVRSTTLRWDNPLLFNIFMKRLLQSELFCREFMIDRDTVLNDISLQENVIDRIFPEKIDTGKNPKTFDWVCGRLKDGTGETMPRELIQFCSELRAKQLQNLERAGALPADDILFERAAFKSAFSPVSKNRLKNTIYAEHAGIKTWLTELRGKKSQQSLETLSIIWSVSPTICRDRTDRLVAIGIFYPPRNDALDLYEIPILYRPALDIVRGAEAGLREIAPSGANDGDDEEDDSEEVSS